MNNRLEIAAYRPGMLALWVALSACLGCSEEEPLENSRPATTSCAENEDCDASRGQRCIGGACAGTCEVHAHCRNGACTEEATDASGERVLLCAPDGTPHGPGQFGAACLAGNTDCDEAQEFRCVGAGQGDVDSYCTTSCSEDADCPSGYFCAEDLTQDIPCSDVCGFEGDAADPACVEDAQIGSGQRYQCGALGLLARECRKREFCNSCETDADCRAIAGQLCARDESGAKICTVRCATSGTSCPWGAAGKCGMWDEAVGEPTCSHAFGSCLGEGRSCEPCVNDRDCPNGACTQSAYTREKYCLDLSVECSCADAGETAATCQGGGCPETPGGLAMICYGGASLEESVLFNRCWGAETNPAVVGSAAGCWPAR